MIAVLLILAAPVPFPPPALKGPPLSLARPEGYWRLDFGYGQGYCIHHLLPGGHWIGFNATGQRKMQRGRWWTEGRGGTLRWEADREWEGTGWNQYGGSDGFDRLVRIR